MEQFIAHRGWSGIAPENTLSAIKLALEEPRIAGIEIDVHLTKDGVPVVIHDSLVDRTTDGSGEVRGITAEELGKLDAGSWFDPAFAGEKVPTLEEVLALVASKKPLLIELKQAAGMYSALEERVIQLIHKFDAVKDCQLISFDHHSLLACKELAPEIARIAVFAGAPLCIIEGVNRIEAKAVSLSHQYIQEEIVESLRQNGTGLIAWTVDDQKSAERVWKIEEKIAITTNHPEHLWK
ncbi:glycerophosphodiester phosphodiesterase family protein [Planomicrobium sp. YIM 101495]|uniref:glycerophosphodiester phosphodiesterase n=1 Tax=Planomicrobium sp. YIM 101495 TaxID=2665160 RepID=UPI0012B8740C